MTNNIDFKDVANRKIIIETRFDPILSMLDKRGLLVDKMIESNLIKNLHWEIGPSEVIFRDNQEKEEVQINISVRYNRINIQSYKIDSVESFYEKFFKLYDLIVNVIGEGKLKRIGCRIIGTYYTKSSDFDSLLNNFLNLFPDKFKLSNYTANDLMFHLNYAGGQYEIGPLSDNDGFYDREFNTSYCKKHVGVAIDTDNFITDEQKPLDKRSLLKDVYTLSLSVEKDLHSMLFEL